MLLPLAGIQIAGQLRLVPFPQHCSDHDCVTPMLDLLWPTKDEPRKAPSQSRPDCMAATQHQVDNSCQPVDLCGLGGKLQARLGLL